MGKKREIFTGLKPQSKEWVWFWGSFVRICSIYTAPENYYNVKDEIKRIRSQRTQQINRMRKTAANNQYLTNEDETRWQMEVEGSYLGKVLMIVGRMRKALEAKNKMRASGQFDALLDEYASNIAKIDSLRKDMYALVEKLNGTKDSELRKELQKRLDAYLRSDNEKKASALINRNIKIREELYLTPAEIKEYCK